MYKNENRDTAILQLCPKENKAFPPSIRRFSLLIENIPVFLIGHPNAESMGVEHMIEIYKYSEEEVEKSNKWINDNILDGGNWYEGIKDPMKILFRCKFREGASGALGGMVMPKCNEPIGVLMLFHGHPGFYYRLNRPFSKTDKKNFLIVEQGVLFKTIKDDMESDILRMLIIDDDSIEVNNLKMLKDKIFGIVMLREPIAGDSEY